MFTNLLQVGISTCNFPVFFLNILFIINNLCFTTSTDADCYLLFPLLFSWLLVFPQRKNRFPCVEGGFSVPALKLNRGVCRTYGSVAAAFAPSFFRGDYAVKYIIAASAPAMILVSVFVLFQPSYAVQYPASHCSVSALADFRVKHGGDYQIFLPPVGGGGCIVAVFGFVIACVVAVVVFLQGVEDCKARRVCIQLEETDGVADDGAFFVAFRAVFINPFFKIASWRPCPARTAGL